ncbi:DinB family protein [Rhodococcus chondri]|uniref:DinB family protein n=1 Tax=Rhodococcus chondri TaxID=3065941 RepID=A0ABU7JR73_9NOCA|nr:DinB family protein [Rhodococcus sp. CC-R104]MEE2032536.1 DinB family protein [Rhodococcus sp. CC-R104]
MTGTEADEVYQAVVAIADESLVHLREILSRMSYEQANTVPALPGANSPYAIVTHCVGMTDYWGGSLIAGLRIPRDRDAEFDAHGDPQQLCDEVERLRRRLPEWVKIALTEGVRDRTATGTNRSDAQTASPTWMLVHIVRELSQHLGQLEITRDLLSADDH